MKSSPNSFSVWTPPELGAELPKPPQPAVEKAQALAIFQNEEGEINRRLKSVVHSGDAHKHFTAWQPAHLGAQVETAAVEEWAFLDVHESHLALPRLSHEPKDMSKVFSERAIVRSESEASLLLEQARRQAEEIILAAQREADEALLQVESEIEAQKNLARQQGRDEARAELGQALEVARKMVAEVETWQAELAAQGETILVEMLKDIARKMFGEGVKLDPETLHTHLTQVMENARGLGVLKIFLNPNDARLLDPSWSEQQMLSLGEQVKIVPSGNIARGGCLVKGNVGTVDARVETQLEAILKSLVEAGE